jgi:hypothetical protein
MASTTTNLGLTKPAYSDDADISDINGNMDLIDAEAGRVRANVAANYDSSETYAVGDYCLHDGSLYKCSTAISSPEAWTAGHWTQIKITGELSALNGKIVTLTSASISNLVCGHTLETAGNFMFEVPSGNIPISVSIIPSDNDNYGIVSVSNPFYRTHDSKWNVRIMATASYDVTLNGTAYIAYTKSI